MFAKIKIHQQLKLLHPKYLLGKYTRSKNIQFKKSKLCNKNLVIYEVFCFFFSIFVLRKTI